VSPSKKTLAFFLGSAALLAGFYVVLDKMQDTLEGRLAEHMALAVDQLGKDNLELRLGGIYTLERLARHSENESGPVMEILAAFVRERASWKEDRAQQDLPLKLAPDIQAALTVIGRRKHVYKDGETQRLDLRKTDLRRADLSGAHLEGAILSGAHLEGAILNGAYLMEAILREARLEHASLIGARLEKAYLSGARLDGAVLREARLTEAFASGARLDGADLLGADLTDVFGLTWEQIKTARKDNRTRFPDDLKAKPQAGLP